MDEVNSISGVYITPLKQIFHPMGNIFHGMKKSDQGYTDFGEAYFSTIISNDIKPWKKHLKMTLNIVVPIGVIKFVIYDGRDTSITNGEFFSTTLSPENYCRLTVPPGVWMAFKGIGGSTNLLLNIADIVHDPDEQITKEIDFFDYNW
jgi:dTDP-4-dehydrorhamnose 3,5-epimerase